MEGLKSFLLGSISSKDCFRSHWQRWNRVA
ncbi:hypothetical protein Ahy_A10g050373 isoform E [Arachis hypogaea]|uniref:Uncharacterized protein n=1 Tax=Arachis hypogaea TaxID=3818 RepID=A0A445B964_ARAHY|nr:hypothetical protein Ahy_A10g050373 isoform E [Arachis hypogaea]